MSLFKQIMFVSVVTGTLFLLLQQPLLADSRQVICSSDDLQYTYCRVNTEDKVILTRQLSGRDCVAGQTWGYDDDGIWVDRGCSAEFSVGSSEYDEDNRHFSRVPEWAVGNFEGRNERDHTAVRISISPEGDVIAVWAGETHRGSFEEDNMQLDGRDFIIRQHDDGFETILRTDHGNRVFFRRR